ncbi:MAG: hypothetical protein IPK82_26355 [Polyangiaceae bacterium]|nr:hypothetical protein [Polyangiaceae bacterium]
MTHLRFIKWLFGAAAAAIFVVLPCRPASADSVAFKPLFLSETDLRFDAPDRIEGEDGFALVRARLGARIDVGSWLSGVAQAEWAREKPALLDAYTELRPLKWLAIRVGASKTPLFAGARDEWVANLPIPERSMVVNAFWPGRDLGAELHLLPTPNLPIEAWVRAGNGSGAVLGNDNSDFAMDMRLDVALGRAIPTVGKNVFWGVRFGAGLHVDSVEDRPGVAGTTAGAFTFYRPPTVSGGRRVVEAHAVTWVGPVRVSGEFAFALESRGKDTDGNPDTPRVPLIATRSSGGGAEVAWMITGQRRVPGAWPVDTPWNQWDFGALELAARVERLDLGVGAPDVTAGGATSGAVALRWWATNYAALSAAFYGYLYDRPPIEEPDRKDSWVTLLRLTLKTPDTLILAR